jgi:hypothetical protein
MRTRKAVITIGLAAAALAATAATPALAATPYVGHNVGGGLLTRQALHVGEVINVVGTNGANNSRPTSARISNYRVTAEHRDGEAYYVTVSPRLQTNGRNQQVLFTTSG